MCCGPGPMPRPAVCPAQLQDHSDGRSRTPSAAHRTDARSWRWIYGVDATRQRHQANLNYHYRPHVLPQDALPDLLYRFKTHRMVADLGFVGSSYAARWYSLIDRKSVGQRKTVD